MKFCLDSFPQILKNVIAILAKMELSVRMK